MAFELIPLQPYWQLLNQDIFKVVKLQLENVHILCNHRGGRGSLKCLHMIMGERDGGWPYDDINKNIFFHKIK